MIFECKLCGAKAKSYFDGVDKRYACSKYGCSLNNAWMSAFEWQLLNADWITIDFDDPDTLPITNNDIVIKRQYPGSVAEARCPGYSDINLVNISKTSLYNTDSDDVATYCRHFSIIAWKPINPSACAMESEVWRKQ